jgi:hypothetical protein
VVCHGCPNAKVPGVAAVETDGVRMRLRVGYEMAFRFPQPTAMVLMLHMHPSRAAMIRKPEHLEVEPWNPGARYPTTPIPLGTGAAALPSHPGMWCSTMRRSSKTTGNLIRRPGMRCRTTCRIYRMMSSDSCWPAATVRWFRELAAMDGVFVVHRRGVMNSAVTYLNAPAGQGRLLRVNRRIKRYGNIRYATR